VNRVEHHCVQEGPIADLKRGLADLDKRLNGGRFPAIMVSLITLIALILTGYVMALGSRLDRYIEQSNDQRVGTTMQLQEIKGLLTYHLQESGTSGK
jgi:hypothetical protein